MAGKGRRGPAPRVPGEKSKPRMFRCADTEWVAIQSVAESNWSTPVGKMIRILLGLEEGPKEAGVLRKEIAERRRALMETKEAEA